MHSLMAPDSDGVKEKTEEEEGEDEDEDEDEEKEGERRNERKKEASAEGVCKDAPLPKLSLFLSVGK